MPKLFLQLIMMKKHLFFKYANYAIVGDIYEVIPKLIEKIKVGEKLS